jgi:muramidase (phage lysozyme)
MTKKLDSMLENPNVQQFLDFLGKAEGADYDVIVGGAKFDDFSKHPARVGLRTKYGPSTAAGKYQITKTTFDDVAPKLKLKDFSPRSQDLAALFLIQRRGALDDVASGNWDEAISKLGKEWASLPSSPYTQPKRDEEFVRANLPAADEEPVRSIVSRETVPTDQGPSRDLEQLPESYRLALAANYLADTEDEPVVEQAMRAAEEAEASGGGGGQIPALGAFALSQQAVDPFQFVLRRPEEEQAVMDQGPRRRPVPRMPQGFASGGPVGGMSLLQAAAISGGSLKPSEAKYLKEQQEEVDRYNAAVDAYRQSLFLSGDNAQVYGIDRGKNRQIVGFTNLTTGVRRDPRSFYGAGNLFFTKEPNESYFVARQNPTEQYAATVKRNPGKVASYTYTDPRTGAVIGKSTDKDPFVGTDWFYNPTTNMISRFSNQPKTDFSPEKVEQFQKQARLSASQRRRALEIAADPDRYGLSGLGGFGFADGGSVSKSGVNRLKQARAVPAMPRFQDGGEVDLAEQMTVGTIPRGPGAIPRYDPVDANPANLMEQMSVGTLPEQEQPSPVDTAVSDYLRMQSQLLTDPKEWFRASGQRLAETIERDPEEFAMGFTGAGIGGILKPKGGTFLSGPASEFTSGMDSFKGILEARIRRNPGTPVAERGKAAMDFFDKQFKNYYQRKLGSPDDALREAFVQGRFKGKDLLSQENLDFLANQRVLANQTENPQVSNAARQNLEKWYDEWIGLSTVVPESMPRPLTESLLRRQAKLQEQGFPVSQDQLYRGASEQLPASSMDPGSLRAIREGDVAYDATSSNLIEGRMRYLDDYLGTLSPQQIRNMRFEDAMINAERYHELLERAAQRNLTPRELFEGREKVIDVGDRRWTDVKNPKALEIEGQYMDHCIGGAGYCEELTSGIGKHFSLQDIKTGEPHTTLSIYRSPFSDSGKHVIIKQIKGRSNSAPEKYFPEIEAFLDHYEKQVGKIYITENRNHIPFSFRGSEYTEMPRGYRGLE